MKLVSRAPAKINLTLHVVARRPDGYHELESLVAFAGAGDTLYLTPGDTLSFTAVGPTADLAGPADDNLVLRAARLLGEQTSLRTGAFHLVKRLPVAAGIGGGSSDAAAALRLLADANAMSHDDPRVMAAARKAGSDVPVCMDARARMMGGAGETLGARLRLPPLFAVLVNPRTPVETAPVFAGLGLLRGQTLHGVSHPFVPDDLTQAQLFELLSQTRNDMQTAATKIAPVIADVIDALRAAPDCRLARMSGSGATCFGLFETCHKAARAAAQIRARHTQWWIKPTQLR